jgi:hypothetical protein
MDIYENLRTSEKNPARLARASGNQELPEGAIAT